MRLALLLALAACTPKHPADPVGARPVLTDPVVAPATPAEAVAALALNFERVQFGYDSATLDREGRSALSANAAILQKFPEIRVEVQGHADERGTIDYNLSLGERRARAVVDELSRLGAPARGLSTISYGEERPRAAGADETVWAQNRRAEFRIVAGAAGVAGTTAS